jgi:hypothetical protein
MIPVGQEILVGGNIVFSEIKPQFGRLDQITPIKADYRDETKANGSSNKSNNSLNDEETKSERTLNE